MSELRRWQIYVRKDSRGDFYDSTSAHGPATAGVIEVVEASYDSLRAKVRDLIIQLKDQGCILPGEIDTVAEIVGLETKQSDKNEK